jgi:hypothetical protein
MKKTDSRPSALSLLSWPLMAMGLAFCHIKNEQVSAYLNFDIITISLLVISTWFQPRSATDLFEPQKT